MDECTLPHLNITLRKGDIVKIVKSSIFMGAEEHSLGYQSPVFKITSIVPCIKHTKANQCVACDTMVTISGESNGRLIGPVCMSRSVLEVYSLPENSEKSIVNKAVVV